MLIWLVALAAAVAAAAFSYGLRPAPRLALVGAVLRGIAVGGVVALLFDAVAGTRRPARPIVALDVSASWRRGRDTAGFAQALRTARDAAGGRLVVIGDSLREAPAAPAATDRASRVRPAVERALAEGRPLSLVTDGELDDPEALEALPGGSRIDVMSDSTVRDAAIDALRVRRAVAAGDTLDVDVDIVAAGRGSGRGNLVLELGERRVSAVAVDSLGAYGERVVHARVVMPSMNGSVVLRAALTSAGDAEARNDTLATTIEVSPGAAAVLVSSSPDFDARELAAVLRGTVSLPTRGFFRVAPGVWREDGALASVSDSVVRRVARDAPLLVLHGDTAIFGEPRAFSKGALLLFAPPTTPTGEWFPTGTPPSPMATALSGSPWDSLPPLEVSAPLPAGEFEVLETRRARRLERRAAAVGWERPRRMAVVGASGFWRWRFHGGVGAGVFGAFWGSMIDWLAAERVDARAAVPVDGTLREGRPVRWRRGSPTDTVVAVTLTSRTGAARTDTLHLRFPPGTLVAESAPLDAGTYLAAVRGGTSTLVVNPSAEVVPRRPSVRSGAVGIGRALTEAPRLRGLGLIFAAVIAALCGEWLLRRKLGLH